MWVYFFNCFLFLFFVNLYWNDLILTLIFQDYVSKLQVCILKRRSNLNNSSCNFEESDLLKFPMQNKQHKWIPRSFCACNSTGNHPIFS